MRPFTKYSDPLSHILSLWHAWIKGESFSTSFGLWETFCILRYVLLLINTDPCITKTKQNKTRHILKYLHACMHTYLCGRNTPFFWVTLSTPHPSRHKAQKQWPWFLSISSWHFWYERAWKCFCVSEVPLPRSSSWDRGWGRFVAFHSLRQDLQRMNGKTKSLHFSSFAVLMYGH